MASEPRARLTPVTPRPVTFVDSNVILDIVTEDPAWAEWSADALAQARDDGQLVINPIVYAEVSTGFGRIEDLDDAVPADDFQRETLPYEAGFIAGKAFLAYRRRGGQKRSPLPDFYIGAHAAAPTSRLLRSSLPNPSTRPASTTTNAQTSQIRAADTGNEAWVPAHRLGAAGRPERRARQPGGLRDPGQPGDAPGQRGIQPLADSSPLAGMVSGDRRRHQLGNGRPHGRQRTVPQQQRPPVHLDAAQLGRRRGRAGGRHRRHRVRHRASRP